MSAILEFSVLKCYLLPTRIFHFNPMAARVRPLRKIALILLLVVLLPAIFYSAYELSTLSRSEELMSDIYRQQLDVILFSMNQYASDVANSWASDLMISWGEAGGNPPTDGKTILRTFLGRHPLLQAAFVADSAGAVLAIERSTGVAATASLINDTLAVHRTEVERLERFMRVGYRKFESIPLRRDSSGLLMLYFTFMQGSKPLVAGYLFEPDQFIREMFAPRIIETFRGEFDVAIFKGSASVPISASGDIRIEDLKSQKELWYFPNHFIGIRKHGETVEELIQARFTRNLLLIVLLDIVLVIGAWIVYRSLRREMELIRLKSDFISSVSHELRTPLALIRMYAETLEMGRVPTEVRKQEYYGTILSEAERLSALVNNILDFSRMEAGKKEYHFNPVDLNEVAADVLRVYAVQLRNEGFAPVVDLSAALPQITADKEAVKEALINLVDNAVKYSPTEKYVRLSTGTCDGSVWVDVEDHGIGIPSEFHAKIFETFFRVATGLAQTTRGSGLGLALVQRIMDAHHGKVTVESVPGQGSRFRLIFPLPQPPLKEHV